MRHTSSSSALTSLIAAAALLLGAGTSHGQSWGPTKILNSWAFVDGGDDHTGQIATDGNGTWIVVWNSNVDDIPSGGGPFTTDHDIVFARSTDAGLTWTPAAYLNTDAAVDASDDTSPTIATNGLGTWLVTWPKASGGGWLSRSTDNGTTWSAPALLADCSGGNPTYGAGVWMMAGVCSDGDFDMYVSRSFDDGVTWSAPTMVHPNNTVDDFGRIAFHADGWVAVWETILGGAYGTDRDIAVSRSEDNGDTWSPPAPLNTNAATDANLDSQPHFASDGGTLLAVWTVQPDGYNELAFARSFDGGTVWTPPATLNSNAGQDVWFHLNPFVLPSGGGRWTVVWNSSGTPAGPIGDDGDILSVYSTDSGATWSAPVAVNYATAPYDDGSPGYGIDVTQHIATDAAGTYIVVWKSNWNAFPGYPYKGVDWDVCYSRISPIVPASKCSSNKIKAAGKKAGAKLTCLSKGISKGVGPDSTCLAKAEVKFSTTVTKADAKTYSDGGCLTTGDLMTIESKVDALLSDVDGLVADTPPGAASPCDAAKVKAAGKKVEAKLTCHSKAVTKVSTADSTCLAKAEVKFSTVAAKAETKSAGADCTATGDSSTYEMLVDATVDDVTSELKFGTTTTTTTTSTSTTDTSTSTTSSTTTTT